MLLNIMRNIGSSRNHDDGHYEESVEEISCKTYVVIIMKICLLVYHGLMIIRPFTYPF